MEQILEKLVGYQTVTSNREANNEALAYAGDYLSACGMQVQEFEYDGYRSVVATTREGSKTPAVMLAAHLDVVPATADGQFRLTEQDGKLFGRGVYDMKFAAAAYLQLADELHKAGTLGDYDFGVMFTTDEEIGGENGVGRLVKEGYRPRVCILPDGGKDWQLETFAKGNWRISIEASGVAAHGSRPWEGSSASFKLIDLLGDIKKIFENQGPDTNTLNISYVRSGGEGTVIPARGEATMDVRFISEASFEDIRTHVIELLARYDARIAKELVVKHSEDSVDNHFLRTFAEIVEARTGKSCGEVRSNGASDARFWREIGVPCIVTYIEGGNLHSNNEWISRESLHQFKDVVMEFLGRTALQ